MRQQKLILGRLGFDPRDWLVCKTSQEGMVVECRYTGQHRTIAKNICKEDIL